MVTYHSGVTDDDRVFKALADPTRRFLLDRLFERDGRTLTELESELEMTRFGVMKHLRVLEDAGLVVARRSGREKLHFLEPGADPADPRPVDRQVHRAPGFGAREPQGGTGGHGMSTMTETGVTQVYRVYIKATPQAIWDAITKPEWSERYGYPGRGEYDLRPGGELPRHRRAPRWRRRWAMPELLVEGEVIEADPPRKLVQTWRAAWDPDLRRRRLHPRHLGDRRGGRRRDAADRHP